MSKARTVPGEALSSRLSERGGSRARIGPQRAFYQRLGLSDPMGDDEAEQAASNGMFSYISASKYYRELRSHRYRMMWRLGAIRHRSVAGERLRAAGPRFTAPTALSSAALPNTSEFVLIDHEARNGEEEDVAEAGPTRRRRSESPGRRRSVAARAVERSVGRSDIELTRALAQIEGLLQAGPVRSKVQEIARDLPQLAPERRAERVREVLRTVERAPSAELAAPPRRAEPAQRPAAVASRRLASAQRDFAPLTPGATSASPRSIGRAQVTGPAGLEPVLRTSPAIRATQRAEAPLGVAPRLGARPDAIERLAGASRTRRAPLAPTQVPLLGPADEAVEEQAPAVRAAPASRAPVRSAFQRAKDRELQRAESEAAAPTARIAQALAGQALAPTRTPEVVQMARGLEAARPSASLPAAASPVQRAITRDRAGSATAGSETPISGAASSWLSDVLQPERRALRASRATTAAVRPRTLAVAGVPALLEPQAEAVSDEASGPRATGRAPAPAAQSRGARAAAPAPLGTVPTSRRPADRVDARPTTLRALTRADVDPDLLAPTPVPRPRPVRPVASGMAVLQPSQVAEVPADALEATPARRAASPVGRRPMAPAAGAPVGAAPTAAAPVTSAPVAGATSAPAGVRAARRLELHQPERSATAPLFERVTAIASDRQEGRVPTARAAITPRGLDLVALNPVSAAPSEDADQPVTARRAPAAEGAPARRVLDRAADAPAEEPTARRAGDRTPVAATSGAAAPSATTPGARASRAPGLRAPATRRAAHRSVEPASVPTRRRTALAAPPAAFVDPVAAQQGLDSEASQRPVARRAGDDRPTTRAMARDVRTARVDGQDRARFVAAPTDYLDVAAAADAPFGAPVGRRPRTLSSLGEAVLPRFGDEAPALPATRTRSPQTTTGSPGVAAPARRLTAPELGHTGLVREARQLATALAASRGPAASRRVSLTEDRDVAVRPAASRRPRSVVPVQHLAAPMGIDTADTPESPVAAATRRTELPAVARSLRQVAATFRAAERDGVHVVTIDAARRSVEPASAGASPITTAILERDDAGRLVRARAHRTVGSSQSAALDFALPARPEQAPTGASEHRLGRGQAVADRSPTAAVPRGVRRAAAPMSTVLASPPTAWAEERAGQAEGRPERRVPGARSVASPTRRAARRQARPVPEGPVRTAAERLSADAPAHRLTSAMAPRRLGAPEVVDLETAGFDDVDEPTSGTTARRGRTHSANTWTDLAQRAESGPRERSRGPGRRTAGRRGERPSADSPSWVRRAVEPSVERPERQLAGSTMRAGGGLLTALARAADPEEIVRVIMQRSHEAGALAREMPGTAGQLVQEIASQGGSMLDGASAGSARANRGEVVPSAASRRARTAWLDADDSRPSRGVRTRSGSSGSSEGHDGVGSSSVMKLAGKLKKLIHLAEHARRLDEARAAVRMAEESAEARAEVGAGRAGGQEIEEDNMHRERLFEEVISEVQHRKKMKELMGGEDDGGW